MKKILLTVLLLIMVFTMAMHEPVQSEEITMDFHNSELPQDIPPKITMDFANSGLPDEIPIDPGNHITMGFKNSDLPPDIPPMIALDFHNSDLPLEIPPIIVEL